MSENGKQQHPLDLSVVDDEAMREIDDLSEKAKAAISEMISEAIRQISLGSEIVTSTSFNLNPMIQALNILSQYTSSLSVNENLQAMQTALTTISSGLKSIPQREISIPEEFYDVAAPLLEAAQTIPDSEAAPELSSAIQDVKLKPKVLTVDRVLALISILLSILFFVRTEISSNIGEKHEAERDQAQIETAQRTNDLLAQQIEINKRQLAVLQSLDDSAQHLSELADLLSESQCESADASDSCPDSETSVQVNDFMENQTKPQ